MPPPSDRSGFDRDVWEGRKPLVAPLTRDIDLGSVVWEKAPDDADYERRGGMVVAGRPDTETGERLVTILTGKSKHGRRVCNTFELATSRLDPALTEPPDFTKLHRVVREICAHVGAAPNAYVKDFDRTLIDHAMTLLGVLDEMAFDASLAAERAREGRAS